MTIKATGLGLRHGAWYALEQAGRLLQAAVLVFENGDSSTGVGLAMFAGEELGRSRILRDLAKKVDEGEEIAVKAVQKACDDHVEKQKRGIFGITFYTDKQTGLGKVMQKQFESPVGSPEWKEAQHLMQVAFEAKKKQLPQKLHALRMGAFYIDLEDSGEWRCPNDISREEASRDISDVVNNYAQERDRMFSQRFPDMTDALEKMTNPKPCLALPRWPH
jgi:AbiV family abortive infection protein